jgi:hypothetical protein
MSKFMSEHRHLVCVPNGYSARCRVKRRRAHRPQAYVPAPEVL